MDYRLGQDELAKLNGLSTLLFMGPPNTLYVDALSQLTGEVCPGGFL